MLKIIKNSKGLTLIELLVSIAILSFVLIAFLNLFIYGASYIAQARQKSNTSADSQSMADKFLGNSGSITNTVTTSNTLNIYLTSSSDSAISVTVTEATITYTNGNQTSIITTIKP